ncbi:MAG: hypothetical protein AAFY26_14115 [Cyanobacteria bacterium J06638_22]
MLLSCNNAETTIEVPDISPFALFNFTHPIMAFGLEDLALCVQQPTPL